MTALKINEGFCQALSLPVSSVMHFNPLYWSDRVLQDAVALSPL